MVRVGNKNKTRRNGNVHGGSGLCGGRRVSKGEEGGGCRSSI